MMLVKRLAFIILDHLQMNEHMASALINFFDTVLSDIDPIMIVLIYLCVFPHVWDGKVLYTPHPQFNVPRFNESP